jgi:U4/U6 small nuclear ribonucleoprotein PRP3
MCDPFKLTGTDLIAQKRAEIAAKLAAMKKPPVAAAPAARATTGIAAPTPKVPILPASLPSKVVFNVAPSPTVSSGPTPATPASGSGTPDDLARRVAEAKRRVAEAQSKLAIKDNPYMVCLLPIYVILC